MLLVTFNTVLFYHGTFFLDVYLNGSEPYTSRYSQRLQKLFFLHLSTDCFMKISLQSTSRYSIFYYSYLLTLYIHPYVMYVPHGIFPNIPLCKMSPDIHLYIYPCIMYIPHGILPNIPLYKMSPEIHLYIHPCIMYIPHDIIQYTPIEIQDVTSC